MVKKNGGITLLPRLALEKSPQIDRNKVSTISDPTPSREIGMVTHINFTKQKIIDGIGAIIKDEVSKYLQVDKGYRKISPLR